MPSLLSLSNELLLHIASYFKYHGDINSFMRITGRLYYLLRTNLYRHGIDRDKSSALEWAAKHGMESAVQRMINLGAISKTTKHELWFILVQALKNKHGGVVKLLLENGVEANFNQAPQEWTYPACLDKKRHLNDTSTLFMALISGCESTLRVMLAHELKEGPTGKVASKGDLTIERFFTDHLPLIVNRRTNGGSTPLVEAVRNGATEAVRFLLSVGADPNMSSKFYSTALQMARSKRNIEAFRLLLENGASPKRSWEDWYLDLSFLSTQDDKKWDVEATSLLLKHSKMRNGITDSRIDQGMLLTTAVTCGCTPVVRQILEKGSHEDDRPWGSRLFLLGSKKPLPLTTAVEWGYMDMIALLLDYGADPAPYRKDWPRTSPLNTAIARDRVDIVKMLMDRGVGLEVHRRKNHDPLDANMLGRVIRSPSMLQLFLERGILDLNCPSINDLMASAVDAANAVLLQILHDKGVALRMSARPGQFRKIHTLEAAIREGCQAVVTFLFSKGLSPKPGRYLEHAVYAKDSETANAMIDLLLRHGTDPNKMNDTCSLSGCTREYCACNRTEDQRMKVVRFLLDKGANPLPESSKWARDTLRRAARKKHTKVVRLLLQAINDTHGVSLDDVQRNLRCVESLYSQLQGAMKKFLEDCYWRKKYPVP